MGTKIKALVEKVTASRPRPPPAAPESSDEDEISLAALADTMRHAQPDKADYPPVPPLDDRSMADTWLKLTGDAKCDDTLEVGLVLLFGWSPNPG